MVFVITVMVSYTRNFYYGNQPFKDETHTALFKDPVRTAL